MNHVARALVLFPLALCAAEVWEAKPFQDWNDKDLQRVTTRSPWVRQARAALSGGVNAGLASSTPSLPETSAADSGSPRGPAIGIGVGQAGVGAGGLGAGQSELGQIASATSQASAASQQSSLPVNLHWQTALPMRQAQMRAKYGKEAGTSPEAQKFLTQEPGLYVIAVTGLPGQVVSAGAGDQAKDRITRSTTLTPKGKAPVRPLGVELVPSNAGVDVLIGFPRTTPIILEDQDVDFTSQIGTATVKYRFRLKEMVFKGRLEL